MSGATPPRAPPARCSGTTGTVPDNASRVASLEAEGRWRVGNGTVALPSLSFVSDPDSGLYRIGANNVGLALNGSKVVDFKAAGVEVVGTLKVADVTYPGALAAGDIFYASAANTLSRLAKGADGQLLGMGSAVPGWITPAAGVALPAAVTLTEAQAGTAIGTRLWSPLRVSQAITALAGGFDLRDDVTTSATIANTDRLVFSDESASGDPNRYTTAANLAVYLNGVLSLNASRITAGTLAHRADPEPEREQDQRRHAFAVPPASRTSTRVRSTRGRSRTHGSRTSLRPRRSRPAASTRPDPRTSPRRSKISDSRGARVTQAFVFCGSAFRTTIRFPNGQPPSGVTTILDR